MAPNDETQHRYELLRGALRDIVLVIRPEDGRILDANDAARAAYGYDHEELLTLTIHDLRAPEARSTVAAQMAEAERHGFLFETVHRRKDSSTFPVEVSSRSAAFGTCRALLSVIRDITERKRTETALTESQATLRAIVDSTTDLIWSVDSARFGLLFFNEAMREYFLKELGIRLEPGMRPEAGFPDEEHARLWCDRYERALREGPYTTEHLTYTQSRTLLLSLSPMEREGRIFGIAVFGKDITERKQAEERERKIRERLVSAVDAAGLGFYEQEALDERTVFLDKRAKDLLALESGAEAELYQLWLSQVHPEGRTAVARLSRQLRQGGLDQATGEYRYLHPSRGTIWLHHEVRVLERNPLGAVVRQIGVLRDVTESKRAEAELRESEENYRQLLDAEPDAIFLIDNETGRILRANVGACALYGYSQDELLALRNVDLSAEPEETAQVTQTTPVVSDRVVNIPLRWHRKKDGTAFPVEISGRFFNHRSRPAHIAAIRDITKRMRMEAEREQLAAQLRQAQKMEAIGTLAGGIAHDFNNILTPIMAHADLALLKLGKADPVRNDIAQLLVAAERAEELVRQILVVSRREEGSVPVPIELNALIKETAKLLRASLPRTIEIRTEVDPACGPVLGDLSQLHQVLLNLCTNAGYAMRETGGTLTISLERANGEGLDARGKWVTLSVRDTGPGIPLSVLDRIFEPYFTTKPVGQGSGLGLAVVHGIVTKHGGEVRVKTAPGPGTIFEVWLPETAGAGTTRERPPGEISRGRGQHVLVVDDEAAIRTVLGELLTYLGYRVTERAGSADALAALRTAPATFDAVITDYTMPEMSGLELAREMLRIRPDLPIILGTGYAEPVDDQVVAEKGLRALVMKPYDTHKLAEALEKALSPA